MLPIPAVTPPLAPRSPPRPALLLAGALALTAAAYARAPQGDFVWDDRLLIERNAAVRTSPEVGDLLVRPFWDRTEADNALGVYYRPLTTFTYWLDARVSGGAAGWFHLVNVLAHLACVALVFHLALRGGGPPIAAALAAGLFGLAPRLTESVAWISGRTDVLATAFALAALAIHRPGRAPLARRVAAAVAVFLGLLCKEVAIAAPAGLAVLAVARARRDRAPVRGVVPELAPAAIAVIAYGVLRTVATAGLRDPPLEATLPGRLVAMAEALARYPLMIVDAFRPRLQIGLIAHPDVRLAALGVAVGVALAILAARAWSRGIEPEIAAALAMAATAIVLVLHVVPIRLNVVAADRFLYLPLAALAVAAARASARWRAPLRRAAAIAALLAIPASAVATWSRVGDWNDEERLWREAVRTSPAPNFVPLHELGNVLFRAGRYAEALPAYEQALARISSPSRRVAVTGNVASALSELGELERARALTSQLVEIEPGVALHRYNLAVIEARRLDFDAAERDLREALRILPGYPEAERALARLGQLRAEAASLPPETPADPTALRARRAELFARLGRDADAARLFLVLSAAPDASADQLMRAAAFLLRRGPTDAGRRALSRARDLGADEAMVRALLTGATAR